MVGNDGEVDGKEEKSWINLFSKYYGGTHLDTSDTGINIDTHLLFSTFSFLRSGLYRWLNGGLFDRTEHGLYWSIQAHSEPVSYHLGFEPTWFHYQTGNRKGYGFPFRCVAR